MHEYPIVLVYVLIKGFYLSHVSHSLRSAYQINKTFLPTTSICAEVL
jgi:hypothetical protein